MFARRHDHERIGREREGFHIQFVGRRLPHDIEVVLVGLHPVQDAVPIGHLERDLDTLVLMGAGRQGGA